MCSPYKSLLHVIVIIINIIVVSFHSLLSVVSHVRRKTICRVRWRTYTTSSGVNNGGLENMLNGRISHRTTETFIIQ